MTKVNKGNKVSIAYTGTFDNGEVFDSNKDPSGKCIHPLAFIAGAGMVIPGFDKAVEGMEKGQKKKFKIPAKEAYGEYNQSLLKTIPKPPQFPPQAKEGMMIGVGPSQEMQVPALIKKITDKEVTLDLNHPLAGKDLTFEIEILDVEEVSPQDFMHSHSLECSCHDHECECEEETCECEDGECKCKEKKKKSSSKPKTSSKKKK